MKTREMLLAMDAEGRQDYYRQFFLDALEFLENPFDRDCSMHFTASGWVVNKERSKVLCVKHKIYNSFCPPGGHADGCENLLEVAKQEIAEETGIRNLKTISNFPITLQVLTVKSHTRRGLTVPPHIHLDVTYLFEADENEPFSCEKSSENVSENYEAKWLTFAELLEKSIEHHMVPIFEKLIARAREFF